MLKKMAVILMAVLVLLMAGCNDRSAETQTTSIENVAGSAETETTENVAESTTIETIENVILGIEDSIFNDTDTEAVQSADTDKPSKTGKPAEPSEDSKLGDSADSVPTSESGKTTQNEEKSTEKPSTETTLPYDMEDSDLMDYEKFHAMSPEEQQKFVDSFENIVLFFDWYNTAQEEYEEKNPAIKIDDGKVNLGEVLDKNG